MSKPEHDERLKQLYAVFDSLIDSVITIDDQGTIIDANAAVVNQLGYQPHEILGKNVTLLMPEPHASNHQNYIDHYLETGERKIIGIGRHVQAKRKDGTLLDVSLAITELQLGDKRRFVGVLRDISAQVARERELLRQRDELSIQANINEIIQTARTPEELVSKSLATLISLPELEVQCKAGFFLVDSEDNKNSKSFTHSRKAGKRGLRLVKTLGVFTEEFLERESWVPLGSCLCGRAALGREVMVSGNCFTDRRHEHRFEGMTAHGHYIIPVKVQGEVVGVIFLYTDPDPEWDSRLLNLLASLGVQIGTALDRLWTLDELNASRQELHRLATIDALTGLMNRRAILGFLAKERDKAARKGHSVAVFMLDIDHFKSINDRYGHGIGDEVLVEVGRRIKQSVRPYEGLGRLGGEEFLVVLPEVDGDSASSIAERIRSRICERPVVGREDLSLTVTASIGIAIMADPASKTLSNDALIEVADRALYRAKAAGRNRIEMAKSDKTTGKSRY